MRRTATVVAVPVLIALLAFSAQPSFAQPGPNIPRMFGTFKPEPGVWSEYSVTQADGGSEVRMRMAIVGKEGNAHWYEVRNEIDGSVNIVKMLVTGDPNESSENIKRMIIKSGDTPAMEMNTDFVVMGRQMATHMFEKRSGVGGEAKAGATVEEVGKREVTVPAGTYETMQYRIKGSDGGVIGTYDVSDKVSPFGIILSESASGSMKLTGHGTDAVTAITEEPQQMTMPPGMPQGMPRGMPPGMGGKN